MKKRFKVSSKYLEEHQNILDESFSITCLLEKVFDKKTPYFAQQLACELSYSAVTI